MAFPYIKASWFWGQNPLSQEVNAITKLKRWENLPFPDGSGSQFLVFELLDFNLSLIQDWTALLLCSWGQGNLQGRKKEVFLWQDFYLFICSAKPAGPVTSKREWLAVKISVQVVTAVLYQTSCEMLTSREQLSLDCISLEVWRAWYLSLTVRPSTSLFTWGMMQIAYSELESIILTQIPQLETGVLC